MGNDINYINNPDADVDYDFMTIGPDDIYCLPYNHKPPSTGTFILIAITVYCLFLVGT